MKKEKKKKAEIFGIDLIIASFIFGAAAILLFHSASTKPYSETETMLKEAEKLSNILLSEGYPKDWQSVSENEIKIVGLGTGRKNEISKEKMERLKQLASNNYGLTKELLSIRYDYNISIVNENKNILSSAGKPLEGVENIIKITRIVIYEKKPALLEIYLIK
ncbi:hypothetical protein B6U82_00640 [Candidatus Pacearchaeota archaeon ex4484_31]|nr:MAG: hypothetical protein B6U82_00640 [Candidatus Pacearchaeota archaeon ex4484_31]